MLNLDPRLVLDAMNPGILLFFNGSKGCTKATELSAWLHPAVSAIGPTTPVPAVAKVTADWSPSLQGKKTLALPSTSSAQAGRRRSFLTKPCRDDADKSLDGKEKSLILSQKRRSKAESKTFVGGISRILSVAIVACPGACLDGVSFIPILWLILERGGIVLQDSLLRWGRHANNRSS